MGLAGPLGAEKFPQDPQEGEEGTDLKASPTVRVQVAVVLSICSPRGPLALNVYFSGGRGAVRSLREGRPGVVW